MTPRNFRTYNPWGHVSKVDRAFRQQLVKRICDDLNGNHWKIWQRPVGSEDERLKTIGTWYLPKQWKAVNHGYGYASFEEAFEMLSRLAIGWGPLEKIYEADDGLEIEYRKERMRYIICNDVARECTANKGLKADF